jgi:hypothetical protein
LLKILEQININDTVFVRMPPRYEGTVTSIIKDNKNKKILLVLSGVPTGAPCRVDISDCILLKRAEIV